jgi:hypothetical protein
MQEKSASRLTKKARRGQRATGFIFFAVVAIPAFMFTGAITVDLSNVIIAHRQVVNTAESAALAGANQIYQGVLIVSPATCTAAQASGNADPCANITDSGTCASGSAGTAQNVALATYDEELYVGSIPNVTLQGCPIINTGVVSGVQEISVTVNYQVDYLLFGPWFGMKTTSSTYTVTETAFVCDSGDTTGPTGGLCSAPQEPF